MRYFPPHPTTAPALPGETGNPEIAYFHLNPACCFASKHTKHIKNITRNVGQCPSWPSCRIQVVPSVQRRKVWLMPTTRVPCHKLPDRSQPLVSRSSPYCGEIWRRYCCLTTFFPTQCTGTSCIHTTTTTTILWPFVRDYPGEPVPEEHSPTHHPDHHPIIISFFHLPRSIASSLFKLRASCIQYSPIAAVQNSQPPFS